MGRSVSCVILVVLVVLCISNALRIDSLVRTSKPTMVTDIPGDCRRVDCILRPKSESLLNCSKGRRPRELSRLQMATDVCMPPLVAGSATKLVKHKDLVEGTLSNGLAYKILPNSVPSGRFEAHLEVLSGSAHELDNQQGMAHLLEHVAYMGSPKRQLISGTGSRTNAYTDFHHTVFFAGCPTQTPDQFWKRPMMPMALDALLDVMTCTVDDDRLEKERAAVLSEASMVNKMEYRVECQILSALHSENRISKRFPIGKEHLIRLWRKEDLQLYHSTHYRPDNVVLFIVGDVDVQETIEQIRTKFGSLRPRLDALKLLRDSGEFPVVSMRDAYRHYPPVTHIWSCGLEEAAALLPAPLVHTEAQAESSLPSANTVSHSTPATTVQSLTPPAPPTTQAPTLRLFTHELLKSFSFHLFAKRPIEPITTEAALRRDIMRRITLSALQIRLNVQQRQDPLFTFVDFNQLNWPREGCAVCSLDLTADTGSWREAVKLAVREIRRLGLYGLTESELQRYKQASLGEVIQGAAQAGQKGHEDVLSELMEAEASGHTYLHPSDRLAYTETFLRGISLEEVNCVARQLCAHLSHPDPARGVQPAAIVASAPIADRAGNPVTITERDIASAIEEALAEPLEPLEDASVPNTLLSAEQMQAKARLQPPAFVPLKTLKAKRTGAAVSAPAFGGLFGGSPRSGGDSPTSRGGEERPPEATRLGVVQRQLSNGLRVSMKELDGEPQKVHLRLYVPGGRLVESAQNAGAVLLGARTIQEGGAFLNMTREEVELFCIDRQVMVEITASDESLVFDFQSVTTSPEANGVTGAEALLQVAHIIMTDFKYEADAFERARQSLHEQYDSSVRGLETACAEELASSLTNGDPRFVTPNHEELLALDLEYCRDAVLSQLDPRNVECAIAGDLSLPEMERLALTYLGTVPPRSGAKLAGIPAALSAITGLATEHQQRLSTHCALPVQTRGASQPLSVFFQDSEERATGYLAGPAPNKFGVFADGETIADRYMQASGKQDPGKWRDPLFCHVALQILQEIANRRLFSVVREERKLTYDASFQLQSREVYRGSWYTVSVTSSPAQVSAALQACQEALTSLKGSFGVSGDAIQSCKRSLLNKFHTEAATNRFWAENLCGTLSEAVPDKTLRCIADYEQVLATVAVPDIQYLVDLFGFEESNMTACVGITGAEPPH